MNRKRNESDVNLAQCDTEFDVFQIPVFCRCSSAAVSRGRSNKLRKYPRTESEPESQVKAQTFKFPFQVVQKSEVAWCKVTECQHVGCDMQFPSFSSSPLIITLAGKKENTKIHRFTLNTSESPAGAFLRYPVMHGILTSKSRPAGPALRSPRCVHYGALGRRRCEETCYKTGQETPIAYCHLKIYNVNLASYILT